MAVKWEELTAKSLPPIDNDCSFLLWRGLRDDDGGFPCIAKRVQFGLNPAYIMFLKASGWHVLEKEEYAECLWAEIEAPEGAGQKRERTRG